MTEKEDMPTKPKAEPNGKLDLDLIELQLLHNMVTQINFPSVEAKQAAASIQSKVEAALGSG